MTEWQWRVIQALIRAVLAFSGFPFPGKNDEELGRRDAEILVEALTRDYSRQERQGRPQ